MKLFKNFLLIIVIFLFSNCSNIDKNINWNHSKKIMKNSNKLKIGDILIKKKKYTPTSYFGHSAIVVSDNLIGEYPKFNLGYCETGILDWLYNDKELVVLRYKYFDEKFKKEFLKTINDYKGKNYSLSFNKYSKDSFYCSKYVWLIYVEIAEKLNYQLNLKKYKNQLYIYPYDFLLANDFEIINISE